jgi:hypothetical protein
MKNVIFILALALSINVYAQEDKTVTLVVSGQGKTQDEAKQNALRSAIEQAFGTFISSKTEILNDNLVKDEIVSITNGNIQKYELLSEGYIPEGDYSVTLRAFVSISKLSSFCESKGIEILFNGDLLSSNIQLIEMNRDVELVSMKNLTQMSKPWLKKCFDYSLKTSEPQNINGRYQITLTVSTLLNSNFVELNKYMINTLKSISMSSSEISKYNKLNIEYYQMLVLDLNKVPTTLFFRNEESLNVFFSLFGRPEDYLQNYQVSNNLEIIPGMYFQKDIKKATYPRTKQDKFIGKYDFFGVTILQLEGGDAYSSNDKERLGITESYAFYKLAGRHPPGGDSNKKLALECNRFPIMFKHFAEPSGKIYTGRNSPFSDQHQSFFISFFCPLDQGLVSVRKFDYAFDKEKIKNISKFEVLPNKI